MGAYNQNNALLTPNSFDLDAEYGPSAFDTTHIFNGYWVYEPAFAFHSRMLNSMAGGWQLAGIFTSVSGAPLMVAQGSQAWGGATSMGSTSGAIPTIDVRQFGSGVHENVKGSGNVGTSGDPARKGSGLNLFADPEKVFNSFRRIELSRDGRSGRANPVRGLPRWNLDISVARRLALREGAAVRLGFDFFSLFNKVDFNDPSLTLVNRRRSA